MSVCDLIGERIPDIDAINRRFETAPASQVISWATQTFGDRICIAASMQDAVLIDLATRIEPDIEVVFIDTGDHMPETLETLEQVQRRYDLNLRVMRVPEPEVAFHIQDPVLCCSQAKVAALEEALEDKLAWMSGLRRSESVTRRGAPVVGYDRRGLVKINPLATWSDLDVSNYLVQHRVPYNPLLDQGYASIGCAPTTRPVAPGEHPRAGRWPGSEKTECGLHL